MTKTTKRGETTIEVPDKDPAGKERTKVYRVKFDWNSAVKYEEAAGQSLGELLAALASVRMGATAMRAMLWSGLRAHHEDVDLEEAGRLLGVIGRKEGLRLMGVAVRYYFPELEEEPAAAPDTGPDGVSSPATTAAASGE